MIGTSDVQCPVSDIVLRGKCLYNGVLVWRTKLSQSYTPRLAEAYGILADQARMLSAQAISQGLPIPHADQNFDDGLPGEHTTCD